MKYHKNAKFSYTDAVFPQLLSKCGASSQPFFYFKNEVEHMKRKLRKVQLSFGRKDDNLRTIFASGTRQNTLRKYLENRTDKLLEGGCNC